MFCVSTFPLYIANDAGFGKDKSGFWHLDFYLTSAASSLSNPYKEGTHFFMRVFAIIKGKTYLNHLPLNVLISAR
jgi:hypothetical protein